MPSQWKEEVMNDRRLEQEVLRALFADPHVDPTRVNVAVRRRVVTLTGSVVNYSEKAQAVGVVERIPSVRAVVDKLAVQGLKKFSRWTNTKQRDEDVFARILNTLYWDIAVPQDRISVSYEDGVVVLAGDVDRPYQKSAAEADVRNIREVRGVRNEIVISPNATSR
jgi:osmotically-inducible protein OsmY